VTSAARSSSWTPDATATLRNGMVVNVTYAMLKQENEANGNLTELDQDNITANLSHAFTLPRAFGRVRRSVRSQLTGVLAKTTTCLRQSAEPGCRNVSDTRRQEFRATFDADLARIMTGGLQFSYALNEARHLDQKFSQIIILASFQLSLFAGDYR
jgi:hypothetical protein